MPINLSWSAITYTDSSHLVWWRTCACALRSASARCWRGQVAFFLSAITQTVLIFWLAFMMTHVCDACALRSASPARCWRSGKVAFLAQSRTSEQCATQHSHSQWKQAPQWFSLVVQYQVSWIPHSWCANLPLVERYWCLDYPETSLTEVDIDLTQSNLV